jgi:hypothetical protein
MVEHTEEKALLAKLQHEVDRLRLSLRLAGQPLLYNLAKLNPLNDEEDRLCRDCPLEILKDAMLDDDRVAGNRPDLLRLKLMTDGKHQLQTLVPPDRSDNGAEDFRPTVHQCPHGSIDQRLSRQSLPWKIHLLPALAINERTRVVELRRPVRTVKVERSRCLGDPRPWRNSGGGIIPVDFQSCPLRPSPDPGASLGQPKPHPVTIVPPLATSRSVAGLDLLQIIEARRWKPPTTILLMVLLPRSTPAIRKNKPSPKLRNNSAALVLQVVLNRSCPNPRPIRANLCLLRPPFHARDQSSAPLDRADAGRRPEGLVDSLDASAFCGQDAAIHICGEMHTDGLPSGVRGRPRERSSLLQPPQRSNGVWLFGASQIAGKIFSGRVLECV